MPDRDTNTPEALLASLRSINQLTFGSDADLDKWKRRTEMVIRRVFGDKSRYLDDLAGLEFHPLGVFADQDEQEERWSVGRAEAGNLIATMLEDHGLEPGGPPALADPKPSSNVFVVHGHDNAMKEALCRTLAQLGLSPIVLHEQANRGRTIIEKFTDHAAVGFAVVLLSPDDVGCERGKEPDGLRPRARQNAVLELGFFVGRLGRGHVMALCLGRPEDLDIPSDYSGVVLTPFDAAGYWQFELVRELNAAGYSLDANKLLS